MFRDENKDPRNTLYLFWDFTLIICLGKSSWGAYTDISSEFSPLFQKFIAQEFPKPLEIFLHKIACMNLVYSYSLAARISTAQL